MSRNLILSGLIFIIGISFSFTYTSDPNCDKIKNGRFYYISKQLNDTIDIVRSDSIQLEMNNQRIYISKSKIIWQSDCSYIMYINSLTDTKLSKFDSMIAKMPVNVKILSVDKTYYVAYTSLTIMNDKIESKDTIYFRK